MRPWESRDVNYFYHFGLIAESGIFVTESNLKIHGQNELHYRRAPLHHLAEDGQTKHRRKPLGSRGSWHNY